MKNPFLTGIFFGVLLCVSLIASASVPFDASSGLIVISVRLNEKEIKALLDTGANVNALDPSLSKEIELDGKSKDLNFSDRSGVNAKTGMVKLKIDGRNDSMPFVLTKTKVTKDCCDALLGKPFFDQHAVLFDFEKSTIEISPQKLPKSKQHVFKSERGDKEILLSCLANGQNTKARLDLGSQQALDVTGEFAAQLKLLDDPKTIFLDSLLQPRIGLARIDAKCGSLKLDPEVPALVHPISKTGLGQGKVGLNIGAPYLRRYYWLVDLPQSRIVFFERNTPPPIAFNPLHVFFASEPEGKIIVKSVLTGGFGDDLGLRVGDRVLTINDVESKSVDQAYALVENNPRQMLRFKMERNGKTFTLEGQAKTLYPRKTMFEQTPYGFKHPIASSTSTISAPLRVESFKYSKFMYHQIEGDFSLLRLLDGISARDLLFRPFLVSINRPSDSPDAIYFDGLKVRRDRTITADLANSNPSLGVECQDQSLDVQSHWVTESIFDSVQTIKGCGKSLRLHASYYLETSDVPAEPKTAPNEPFLYLHDKQTGYRAHWEKKDLTLVLDAKAPDWVSEFLDEAIREYNAVLNPKLNLSLARKDLSSIPLSSPDVIGIYWTNTGHPYDSETRFAQARMIQNSQTGAILDADLILRSAEFTQHEKLVQKIALEAASTAPPEAKEKFDRFAQQKIRDLRKNVIIHELGHLLGLAHNFSEKEKSVMSYATFAQLSEYDRAALRSLYFDERPQRSFELKSTPESGSNVSFD